MKLIKALDALFTFFAVIAMVGIVISVILNVFLRSVFDAPIIWIVEVNGMLVVWLTFLVLGVNLSLKRHFQIELVSQLASKATRRYMAVFKDLVMLLTVVCMIGFTLMAIRDNFTITTSVTEIRVWIAYYLPAIIGSLHALFIVTSRLFAKSKLEEAGN